MKISELREQIQSERSALSSEDVTKLSDALCRRHLTELISLKIDFSKINVGLYWPLKKEPQIQEVIRFFLFNGSQMGFARVLSETEMDLAQIDDPFNETNWDMGAFGQRSPKSDLPEMRLEDCDFIYVPGVAFDEGGARMGRGKGYYDRFLERSNFSLRLALGFDFQLLDQGIIETNDWDQNVDWIQTERRLVKTSQVSEKINRYGASE